MSADDVWDLQGDLQAGPQSKEFLRLVEGGASPLSAIVRMQRRALIVTGLLKFVNSMVQFLPAYYVAQAISAADGGISMAAGYAAAGALFVAVCVKTLTENQYFFRVTNMALSVRSTMQAALFEKNLRARGGSGGARVETLMQLDASRVEDAFYTVHNLWDGLLQIAGYMGLLIWYLGPSSLSGLLILLTLLPMNSKLQKQLSMMNRERLRRTEARTSFTADALRGMRTVKLLGWEEIILRKVRALRDLELKAIYATAKVRAGLIAVFSASPNIVCGVVLLAYARCGGAMEPASVFAAVAALQQLRFPLLFYPSALNAVTEGRAALRRIAEFFDADEMPAATEEEIAAANKPWVKGASPPTLQLKAGRYPLGPAGAPVLTLEEDLEVVPGELLGVAGEVGSGKSALLRALLGELPGLRRQGRVAYSGQRPWIPSGTLLEVVTQGAGPVDPAAFRLACSSAAVDFLKADDEIGEGGAGLSGGQQARVALARIVYHAQKTACPVVLDDVLAALDPSVSAAVFEATFISALSHTTRIISTNSDRDLGRCDRVAVMKRDGDDLVLTAVAPPAQLPLYDVTHHKGEEDEEAQEEEEKEGEEEGEESQRGQLTTAEERAAGAVPLSLYRRYFKAAGSTLLLGAVMFTHVATNVASVGQQWVIGLWTADANLSHGAGVYTAGVVSLGFGVALFSCLRTLLSTAFSLRASRRIHRDLGEAIMVSAPSRHFDENPSGRLLQRFTKDLDQIDIGLPGCLGSALSCSLAMLAALTAIAASSPAFLVPLAPLSVAYFAALQYFRPVSRELKRAEALARTPVFAKCSEATSGLATIRALDLGPLVSRSAVRSIDANTRVSYALKAADRWFSVRMELLGNIVTLSAVLIGLASPPGPKKAALMGVAVTQALGATGLLNWTVRMITDVETAFSSMQRIVYSTDDTLREAPRQLPGDPGESWPSEGSVEFENIAIRYREGWPRALDACSLKVHAGERMGIVGATGSGKSSLLRALLRIVEPEEGTVHVAGEDVKAMGLQRLRGAVAAIPQEEFLFEGTVRENLDPEGAISDEDISEALRVVGLGEWSFDREVRARGAGLSLGERQLLGVARAVARKCKVLAVDEATSRVDAVTDASVQAALRRLPAGTTLLTVSHRLDTLLDYDRVVVMDKGRLVEVGPPQELAARPGSSFARLLSAERGGKARAAATEAEAPVLEAEVVSK